MIKQIRTEERKSDELVDQRYASCILKYDQEEFQFAQLLELISDMQQGKDICLILRGVIGVRKLMARQIDVKKQKQEINTIIATLPLLVKFITQQENQQLCFQSLWAITNVLANMHLQDEQENKFIEQLIPALMKLLKSQKLFIQRQLLWTIGNLAIICSQNIDVVSIYIFMIEAINKFDCIHLFSRVCWTIARLCFISLQSKQACNLRKQLFILLCNQLLSSESKIPFSIKNLTHLYCFLSNFHNEVEKSNLILLFSQIIRRHSGLLRELIRISSPYLNRERKIFIMNQLASLYHKFFGTFFSQQILRVIEDSMEIMNVNKFNSFCGPYSNLINKVQYANMDSIRRLNSMINCGQKQHEIANFLISSECLKKKIAGVLNYHATFQVKILYQFIVKLTSTADAILVLKFVEEFQLLPFLMGILNRELIPFCWQIIINIMTKTQQPDQITKERILSLYYRLNKQNPKFESLVVCSSNQILQQLHSRLSFILSHLEKTPSKRDLTQ